jgi:hypothetical protein
MAALTARRPNKVKAFTNIELPGTAQAVWEGGIACWDTSTGLVAKAAVSTTMIPIGTFVDSKTVASGGTVVIQLFKELNAAWMVNLAAAPVLAATCGGLCYLADDQSVRVDDATNTCSVAGRVWAVDATKGVLVEPHYTAGDRLGGLDA